MIHKLTVQTLRLEVLYQFTLIGTMGRTGTRPIVTNRPKQQAWFPQRIERVAVRQRPFPV